MRCFHKLLINRKLDQPFQVFSQIRGLASIRPATGLQQAPDEFMEHKAHENRLIRALFLS
jgi:hypothetical protein